MSISLVGTVKNAEGATSGNGWTVTVTFDSIPQDGDLIVCSCHASSGTATPGGSITTAPAGFVVEASESSTTNVTDIFRKVAAGETSASYSWVVTSHLSTTAVQGAVFRATNGFLVPAEVTASSTSGGSTTSPRTLDPAGSPSRPDSLHLSRFSGGSPNQTANPQAAFNGGAAVDGQIVSSIKRSATGYKIETAIPSDTKVIWSFTTPATSVIALAVWSESPTPIATAQQKAAFLQFFDGYRELI